jgi:hypothetical protein
LRFKEWEAAAMGMVLTAAAVIAAFNLTCSGMAQFTDRTGKSGQQPYTELYRIDPKRHLFCSGACATPSPLRSISDAMVVFYDFRDGDDVARESFDRRSGRHLVAARKIGTRMRFSRVGRCTVEPFTRFPGLAE